MNNITQKVIYIAFGALICFFVPERNVLSIEFDTSEGSEDIIFMSTDGEVNLGDSLAAKVEKRFKLIKDEAIQKRVNDIGQKIAKVCDRRDIIYHFAVIEDEEADEPVMNAFSLPGGYVYVFKDLYDKIENDDELAGIIGHEVAHIVARHGIKKMQTTIGSNLLLIAGSQTHTTSQNIGKAYAAIYSLMLSYSREDELFSDKMSVKYVRKAGYNPEGVLSFLTKLLKIQQERPIRRYAYNRTHPYISIRISNAKKEIYGKMDFIDYINIPTESNR